MFGDRYMEGAVSPGEVYTLAELEAMPTITQGQADDLKVDEGDGIRIWLSRCGVEDGEPCNNKVTIEELQGGSWVEVGWYEAEDDEVERDFDIEHDSDYHRLQVNGEDLVSVQDHGDGTAYVIVYSRDAAHGVAWEGKVLVPTTP